MELKDKALKVICTGFSLTKK